MKISYNTITVRAGFRLNWAWCCCPEKAYFFSAGARPQRPGRRPPPLFGLVYKTYIISVKFHSPCSSRSCKINNTWLLVCSSQFSTKYCLVLYNIRLLIQWRMAIQKMFFYQVRVTGREVTVERVLSLSYPKPAD